MGVFWDLWQESELEYQSNLAHSLEERVENLETTLNATIDGLQNLVSTHEKEHNKDIVVMGELERVLLCLSALEVLKQGM